MSTTNPPWHIQHVGRIEGEGPERFWAMFNQHSGSTSEQGPSVCTDNFNNIIWAWNEGKAFAMDESLPTQYEDAKKALVKQTDIYDDLTTELPIHTIKEWEEESIKPVKDKKGNWTSPMMDPVFTGGFYETVQNEHKKENSTGQGPGRRQGVVRWLSSAIELEHSIKNYNDEAEEKAESGSLSMRRTSLGDQIAPTARHYYSYSLREEANAIIIEYEKKRRVKNPEVIRVWTAEKREAVSDWVKVGLDNEHLALIANIIAQHAQMLNEFLEAMEQARVQEISDTKANIWNFAGS